MRQSESLSKNSRAQTILPQNVRSTLRGHIDLLDPVTWVSGPQGFISGALASGAMLWDWKTFWLAFAGLVLVGPLLIGFSQSINDFFDRDVDAINEPTRPIPAGLVTLRGAILNFSLAAILAILLSIVLAITSKSGPILIIMTILGLLLGVFYSMPPVEFKRNGLIGPLSVGFGYTLMTWLSGLLIFGPFKGEVLITALVNVFVSTGLLILNDIKSIEGDRKLGLRTLPVNYGVHNALKISYAFIDVSQLFFAIYLIATGHLWIGILQVVALLVQFKAQRDLYATPNHSQYKKYLLTGNGLITVIPLLAALSFGGYLSL
ncbi:(bacterio)chlorophyll synthase [Candidatus Chlorohelix sp.]|uniref:(bacterio)chlorophyll synthase n=1 Tax=Candidatus Chlorohelix sp. TaxID=3139201 RepID=UPI003070B9B0